MQYAAHLATTRALIRTIPAPNPVNVSEFVGISQDWSRVFDILGATLLDAAELVVFGTLGYFLVRRSYPAVARGFGYVGLTLLVILLGALFTCRPVAY